MRCPAAFALVLLGGCAARMPPAELPRLPHAVMRVEAGVARPASDEELDAALRAARAVYVGEEHDDPHHHAAEAELLARTYALDPSVALGMEMLPRAMQPALDDFVAGRSDEKAFLAAVDWAKTWGFRFEWYRPLLAFCRAHRLRAFALNAPHALAHAVAQGGVAGLAAADRAALPEMVPGPPAHRAQLEEAFRAHGGEAHAHVAGAALDHFYEAQLLWDETMAAAVADAVAGPSAPHRIVVVAGVGHARRFAVPQRAERRGVAPDVVVLPAYRREAGNPGEGVDFLWILGR